LKYTDEQLQGAVRNGIFTETQVRDFTAFVEREYDSVSGIQRVLYYGGALITISALTWLMKSSWDSFGAQGMLVVAIGYFAAFMAAGYVLFFRKSLPVAGGLLFSVAIAVVPLLVFSVMKAFDFWPQDTEYGDFYAWIKGKWVVLELATIVVALAIFARTKFSFILFLVSFALWFMSMDIVPILYGENDFSWTARAHVSMAFGAAMIAAGYFSDLKFRKDYSFWLYLFGLMTLTFGFSVFYNDNLFMLCALGLVHVFLIVLSLVLDRTVFLVFGTLGIMEFLSRVSYEWFADSPLFPFSLTVIGVLLIALGVAYQRNRKAIDEAMQKRLPEALLRVRPKRLRE
jgi:hypothetical protein